MKKFPVGTEFYKKKGLEKSVTIHLRKELHDKLRRLAKVEERSLQITARRILEIAIERGGK